MPNDDPIVYIGPDGIVFPSLEKQGLMPHNNGFPGLSRDWEDIDCSAKNCINNMGDKCIIPSLAEIGEDGRCKGFTLKVSPVKNSKPVDKENKENKEITNPITSLEI